MAKSDKCEWCNSPGASSWEREVDGKTLVSDEVFCSRRCKDEYSDRYNITWSKKTSSTWIIVVIIIVIYFLSRK